MKLAVRTLMIVLCMSLAFQAAVVFAQKTDEELALESEAFCVSTASTKPTPEMIIEKVNKAAALVEKEGPAAYPKFKGKDSEFIFAGTYIWIHDGNAVMKMHPIKNKMEGKNYIDLKDSKGKLFFTAMNEVAKAKGSGWVDYMWPKPGEKTPALKVSYVKLVKFGGEELILGCGVYDMSEADVQRVLK
ncbi:MAG: cache domain-containing protein [Syntrophobacteraceae bacterium]